MGNKNSRKLNLMFNNIEVDKKDPSRINFSMIVLDNEVSRNNVMLTEVAMNSLAKSMKGMPVVAKYIEDLEDFGDHEASLTKDKKGNPMLTRDTIAIGSFTEDGKIEDMIIEGNTVRVLTGNGVLWSNRYPDMINLLLEMWQDGVKINTSSEYLYFSENSSFNEDGVEIHDGNIYFEGIAVLGSRDNFVSPAYESATFISLNSLHLPKYNQLVAQALNSKGGEKVKVKFNEMSLYQRSREIESKIKKQLELEDSWLWIEDLYVDKAIYAIEDYSHDVKRYQIEYTVEGNELEIKEDSIVEVKEIKEWKVVKEGMDEQLNELKTKMNELETSKTDLETQLNELKTSKEELATKLNDATETIATLNNQVDEMKALNAELVTYKEQVLLAQKESKIKEVKDAFEAKFNSVDGAELFATEEVQELLNQAIEEGELGLNAKLKLNEKLVELSTAKLEKNSEDLGVVLNSKINRDFSELVVSKTEDLLKELM